MNNNDYNHQRLRMHLMASFKKYLSSKPHDLKKHLILKNKREKEKFIILSA